MTTISIVTGGSRGLGRNTAISIARHGGDVILTYRSGAEGAKAWSLRSRAWAARRWRCSWISATSRAIPAFVGASSRAAQLEPGHFDHLVNNAGHGEMADFAETTEAQFDSCSTSRQGRLLPDPGAAAAAGRWRPDRELLAGLTRVSYPGFSAYSPPRERSRS